MDDRLQRGGYQRGGDAHHRLRVEVTAEALKLGREQHGVGAVDLLCRVAPAGPLAPDGCVSRGDLLEGDRIAALNSFLDTETLFPRFGLPAILP